jgi:hypothetical protein
MIQNDEGQNEEIVAFFKTVIGEKQRPNRNSANSHTSRLFRGRKNKENEGKQKEAKGREM